ncbi:adenylyltransferase/cytidyltransferase family protein [Nanoarchaeota archaeon]
MKTKVMCFGTFDVLHLGHIDYFKQAKKLGDYLIVVIARDKTKKAQKKKTIFSEKERLELVKKLKIVNEAVLGHHKSFLKIIKEKKPDFVCLGYDHKIKEKKLAEKLVELGLNCKVKRMKSHRIHKYKSSKIKVS